MPSEARFDTTRRWRLHPQVSLRDEPFGALAYHYGNRRLTFLKSRPLVTLVSSLGDYESASEAITALVPAAEQDAYAAALGRLAVSEVISAA